MRIKWDQVGEKKYETGADRGVVYPLNTNTKAYDHGYAWNGLTSVSENPSGADTNDLYADNIKYASLRGAEDFGATIEAYTYPDEFALLDGTAELSTGITIGQQDRGTFGFSYRTLIGDDVQGTTAGYKIHLIYGASVSPSEKSYETVNDSPDAITFSWELTTTPVNVTGHKPTSVLTLDTTKLSAAQVKAIEDVLYGTDANEDATEPSVGTDARLPLPDEVVEIIEAAA